MHKWCGVLLNQHLMHPFIRAKEMLDIGVQPGAAAWMRPPPSVPQKRHTFGGNPVLEETKCKQLMGFWRTHKCRMTDVLPISYLPNCGLSKPLEICCRDRWIRESCFPSKDGLAIVGSFVFRWFGPNTKSVKSLNECWMPKYMNYIPTLSGLKPSKRVIY